MGHRFLPEQVDVISERDPVSDLKLDFSLFGRHMTERTLVSVCVSVWIIISLYHAFSKT